MARRHRSTSRVGAGSEAQGVLRGQGRVEIEGVLRGEIDWSGELVVGHSGRLEVRGRVDRIESRGRIDGGLVVTTEATLRPGSVWNGECAAAALICESGAWLEGAFRIAENVGEELERR